MRVRKNLLFTIFILASAGSLYGQGWTFNDGTLNVTSQIWVQSYEFGNTHPSTYNGTPYSEYHDQIKTIILADNITYVGERAFAQCSVAERLVVGKGVKKFAYSAFHFPKSTLKTIEWNAANANIITQYQYSVIQYSYEGPFGRKETYVDVVNCNYAANAETIIFGPDVVSIPDYFAYFMKKLKKVEFGAKVTSIGMYAFVGITPSTVLIARMPNPSSVTLGNTYYNPFPASASDRNKITLKVPAAYINQYKAANIWKDFNIVALENSTEDEPSETQTGVLVGEFSVSSTRKVHFSRGNLQYQASTKKWRFALNQYNYIGSANSNISSTYSGWIDLFGYGTSGWNSGFYAYRPYASDSYDGSYINKDLTGAYANADWGVYNAISNGGNQAGLWRTLTGTEWKYLLRDRPNADIRLSVGKVNSVSGLILLPDDWVLPEGLTFTPKGSSYDSNKYNTTQWQKMENAGAVFLPAAGWRVIDEVRTTWSSGGIGLRGCYHGATIVDPSASTKKNYFLTFYSDKFGMGGNARECGLSVRLVQDVLGYTITWKNWDGTTLATTSVAQGATPSYTGSTPTRPSTAEYAYTFSGWTPVITAATANKTYTATYTATPRYTITFNANGGLIPTGGNMGNTPSGHITTLSADRTSGTVAVTSNLSYFCLMTGDCPTREGYSFTGWFTDPLVGEQVYNEIGWCVVGTYWNQDRKWIGTTDVLLYAHWLENPRYELLQGTLTGLFSISPSQKVLFSQGNLQYNTLGNHRCADGTTQPGTWRFAAHQYDTIGISQTQKANNYYGWVSAFGWGTSGWNSGANIYQPWACTGDNYQDYYPGGDPNNDLTGSYAFADWGVYNAITNGGNQPQLWRTLSRDEWEYLLRGRPNAANLSSRAIVNGIEGCLFLPDDFILPAGMSFHPLVSQASDNSYSMSEWTILENLGAVFIPRDYTYSFSDGNGGWAPNSSVLCYTSSSRSYTAAYAIDIKLASFHNRWKCDGGAVRLVHDALPYTITWQNADGSELEKDENVFYSSIPEYNGSTPTKPADAEYTYTFAGWSPAITAVIGDKTYIAIYTQTLRKYTITVNSSNVSQGSASGGGTYDYGTNHQITATPNECYRFVQWSDGNTDNPRTITVTGDATYTAEFEQIQYTIEAQSADTGQGSATVTNP